MVKRLFLVIMILLFAAPVWAGTTYYVRPESGGPYGNSDGESYANAFNGLENVPWGEDEDEVGPGDTLYVCDTHRYIDDWSTNPYPMVGPTVDGTSQQRITIRGDYTDHPGVIIGARRLETTDFTDNEDGSYYGTTLANSAEFAWEGEPEDPGSQLLQLVEDQVTCASTNGSYYFDDGNNLLWVNPYGALKDVYFNATGAWNQEGRDYFDFYYMKFFGATGNDGAFRAAKYGDTDGAVGLRFYYCEFGYAQFTAWYTNLSTSYVTIDRCDFHHCATGMYTIYSDGAKPVGHGQQHHHFTITNNEFWSGEDTAGILPATLSDRHAIGGQNLSDVLVEGNYVHDWAGDFVIIYNGGSAPYNSNNWIVRRNFVINLNDDNGDYYHYGIARTFSNAADATDRMTGHEYYLNLLVNLGGDQGNGGGAAFRLKGGPSSGGDVPKIWNNVVYDCCFFIWHQINGDESPTRAGWEAKNNIVANLKTGGYYVKTLNWGGDPAITMDYNLYYPDTDGADNKWSWDGVDCTDFADWKSDSSQDANSPSIADPSFVNGGGSLDAATDFQIPTGSPAKNTGTGVGLAEDYAETSIPQDGGYDIGAFEYYSGESPEEIYIKGIGFDGVGKN
jgi:hypothetical protein